jgi:hypothetical protein
LDRDYVLFAEFEGDLVGQFGLGAVPDRHVAAGGARGPPDRAGARSVCSETVAEGTYLSIFRNVARKYPHKPAAALLADLVETTPGLW